jgi:hypothetical protein
MAPQDEKARCAAGPAVALKNAVEPVAPLKNPRSLVDSKLLRSLVPTGQDRTCPLPQAHGNTTTDRVRGLAHQLSDLASRFVAAFSHHATPSQAVTSAK